MVNTIYRRSILSTRYSVLVLLALLLLAGCGGPSEGFVTTPTPLPPALAPSATPVVTALPTLALPPSTATTQQPTATIAAAPLVPITAWSRIIPWRGNEAFLLGVNYPYHRYGNDFGANAWGSYGVHDPSTHAEVDADFARMSSLGVRAVRWFVFADGRAGITFDAQGLSSGLDQYVIPDLDAALEIAQRHNIGLNLVLLDYRFLWDAQTVNGVQQGGHAAVLASQAGRQALLSNVFEPLFERYAGHPAILSWEIMNEPEWGIQDAGDVGKEISHPLNLATFRAFAQLIIDAIHNSARSYATIGSADVKWAQNWVGLGLDYYQIHYYDWMHPYSTDNLFTMQAQSLKLDRPVVVGEFPADHSAVAGLRDYLDTWYANGYAGAWAWSFLADTNWGSPDPEVLSAWADAHKP